MLASAISFLVQCLCIERDQMKHFLKQKPLLSISVLLATVLCLFTAMSVYNAWYQFEKDTGQIIAHDVQQLAAVFAAIDASAGILSFDRTKNIIDFLQIKKDGFVGSEVGALNLKYPHKWNGPYLEKNPTIQNQEYIVLVTKKGTFIVPPDGVRLPNGKIVGKDMPLDDSSDIEQLMADPQGLQFDGKALAVRIK